MFRNTHFWEQKHKNPELHESSFLPGSDWEEFELCGDFVLEVFLVFVADQDELEIGRYRELVRIELPLKVDKKIISQKS